MQFLKNIFNFYVFSNIHVALAAYCMTKISLLKFGYSSNLTPVFVSLSTFVSYNFIRFYEVKTDSLGWLKKWFISNQRKLLVLSVLSIIILLYFLFFCSLNLKSLLILIPFGFMTFFYVVPLLKVGKYEISFRNFPGVKIFSIAIAWAGISVLFPLFESGEIFSKTVYLEFIQRILILIVIILPFDIRDMYTDSKELKTLPIVLGVRGVKILGFTLLLAFVLLEYLKDSPSITSFYIAIITGVFLWFASSKKTRFYTSFWVEAIPMLWLLLIVLFLKN